MQEIYFYIFVFTASQKTFKCCLSRSLEKVGKNITEPSSNLQVENLSHISLLARYSAALEKDL